MIVEDGLEERVAKLLDSRRKSLLDSLGIQFTSISLKQLVAEMPVDERTQQPLGYLHGGASVALAETLASVGGLLQVDPERFLVFGLEINANHVRSIREGVVRGVSRPIHIGRRTQIWDIEICDLAGKLICTSRCTLAVVER